MMALFSLEYKFTYPNGTLNMDAIRKYAAAREGEKIICGSTDYGSATLIHEREVTYDEALYDGIRLGQSERERNQDYQRRMETREQEQAALNHHARQLADAHSIEQLQFEYDRAFYGTMAHRERDMRLWGLAIKFKRGPQLVTMEAAE